MCYAIIVAKFSNDEAQTIKTETAEETTERVEGLQQNDNCKSISVYLKAEKHSRVSKWTSCI